MCGGGNQTKVEAVGADGNSEGGSKGPGMTGKDKEQVSLGHWTNLTRVMIFLAR